MSRARRGGFWRSSRLRAARGGLCSLLGGAAANRVATVTAHSRARVLRPRPPRASRAQSYRYRPAAGVVGLQVRGRQKHQWSISFAGHRDTAATAALSSSSLSRLRRAGRFTDNGTSALGIGLSSRPISAAAARIARAASLGPGKRRLCFAGGRTGSRACEPVAGRLRSRRPAGRTGPVRSAAARARVCAPLERDRVARRGRNWGCADARGAQPRASSPTRASAAPPPPAARRRVSRRRWPAGSVTGCRRSAWRARRRARSASGHAPTRPPRRSRPCLGGRGEPPPQPRAEGSARLNDVSDGEASGVARRARPAARARVVWDSSATDASDARTAAAASSGASSSSAARARCGGRRAAHGARPGKPGARGGSEPRRRTDAGGLVARAQRWGRRTIARSRAARWRARRPRRGAHPCGARRAGARRMRRMAWMASRPPRSPGGHGCGAHARPGSPARPSGPRRGLPRFGLSTAIRRCRRGTADPRCC